MFLNLFLLESQDDISSEGSEYESFDLEAQDCELSCDTDGLSLGSSGDLEEQGEEYTKMPKTTMSSAKKQARLTDASAKKSVTTSKSFASSLDVALPYVITVFKDGLNYRVVVDIQMLSGTCPSDVSVSIEKNEYVLVEFPLPGSLFSSGRLYSSGVELGEDRVAKFEEEILNLRQRNNMTSDKVLKTKFKIQLPMKVEDRMWKSKKTKAIGLHMYDLDKKNLNFQLQSRQTVTLLHVNMTAQEKLIDYDDDDIEFQMFTTDFSNINTSNGDPKKRKTSHDPSASQDENMMETPSKSHSNNFISNENDL